MTVSWYSWRGGRSLPQSKNGLMTTESIVVPQVVVGVDAVVGFVEVVGEQRLVVVDLALDRLGVGVEQQLARVAAVAVLRVVGAVHPEAVALARADAGQVAVPDEAVDLGQVDAGLGAVVVDQAQLDPLGDLGEQGEVRRRCRRRSRRAGTPLPGQISMVAFRVSSKDQRRCWAAGGPSGPPQCMQPTLARRTHEKSLLRPGPVVRQPGSVGSGRSRRAPAASPPRPEEPHVSSQRVAIVTGAARGIGAATAQRLARDGHRGGRARPRRGRLRRTVAAHHATPAARRSASASTSPTPTRSRPRVARVADELGPPVDPRQQRRHHPRQPASSR